MNVAGSRSKLVLSLLLVGCSTAPAVRAARPLDGPLAAQINDLAVGPIDVDLRRRGRFESFRARRIEVVSSTSASFVVDGSPPRLREEFTCDVYGVRVPRGSHAVRGMLIGAGIALAATVAIAAAPRDPESDVHVFIPGVYLGMPLVGGTIGGLIGSAVPKAPLVQPFTPPASCDEPSTPVTDLRQGSGVSARSR